MNELQIFKNEQFGQVRMVEVDGKPYAVGVDVARALEYAKPSQAVIDHCKGIRKLGIPSNGGIQETNVIPEGDIYRLIVKAADQSKNPEIKAKAEKFERWIFDEVIPSIRKHGAYMTDDVLDKVIGNPDFGIKLLTELKKEREEKKLLQQKIEEDKSKVEFAEHVAISNNSLLVREVAKIISKNGIEIGEQRLYKKLRDWGWVFKNSCEATQYAIAQGYMEVSESVKETSKGKFTFKTSRVTGKGQMRIFEKLKEEMAS